MFDALDSHRPWKFYSSDCSSLSLLEQAFDGGPVPLLHCNMMKQHVVILDRLDSMDLRFQLWTQQTHKTNSKRFFCADCVNKLRARRELKFHKTEEPIALNSFVNVLQETCNLLKDT